MLGWSIYIISLALSLVLVPEGELPGEEADHPAVLHYVRDGTDHPVILLLNNKEHLYFDKELSIVHVYLSYKLILG